MRTRQASLQKENPAETASGSIRIAGLLCKAAALWHQTQAGKTSSQVTGRRADLPEELSPKEEQILAGLDVIGPANPASLATYCRIPLPTLQRNLKSLLKRGLITKEGQTRGVRYALPRHKKCHD